MDFFIALISSFLFSVVFTYWVMKIALRFKIVDLPILPRKVHKKPIPLFGGLAIFLSFGLVFIYYSFFTDLIIKDFIALKHVIGILVALAVILIGGLLDDKYNLKPKFQIFFPVVASLIIIFSGIGISHIRNPFGGIIPFNNVEIVLFHWNGLPYKITLLSDLFTFIWLMGMMYTTKILDGLDGLVSGITVIGSVIIFAIALNQLVAQTNTALVALILAGSYLGFLVFNWHPAKIFLGESGSLMAGFLIGVLAIISGSKVATTLLIMGVPIIDLAWVIIQRIMKRKPLGLGDRRHLHHRLLDVGLTHRQAVIFLLFLTTLFGSLSLFLQTFGKLIALGIVLVVMIILGLVLYLAYKKNENVQQI